MEGGLKMGVSCAFVSKDELGIFDGRQGDGIEINQEFISYFRIESALLEFAGIVEAGVIAACRDNNLVLKVHVVLEIPLTSRENTVAFCERIQDFLAQRFKLDIPIVVRIQKKLPMTRSGKILRNELRHWE